MPSGMVVMLICMPFLDVALMLRNGCPCMVCISYRMMSACLVRIGSTSVVPSLGSREGDAAVDRCLKEKDLSHGRDGKVQCRIHLPEMQRTAGVTPRYQIACIPDVDRKGTAGIYIIIR